MKKTNVIIFSIFTALISGFTGYEMGSHKEKQINKIKSEFYASNKNINIIMELKTLKKLKSSKVEEAIERHQKVLAYKLKGDDIEKETLKAAKEYQKNHCKNKCLGI